VAPGDAGWNGRGGGREGGGRPRARAPVRGLPRAERDRVPARHRGGLAARVGAVHRAARRDGRGAAAGRVDGGAGRAGRTARRRELRGVGGGAVRAWLWASLAIAGAASADAGITVDGQDGDWANTQTCFSLTSNSNRQIQLNRVCMENDNAS